MNTLNSCQIRLLGSPSVVAGDGTPVGGRAVQRHRIALLALLALAPGRALGRERLVGYLWPESDPERARQLLNQAVYQVRRALGEDVISSTGDELRLNAERLRVDVVQFEDALARGDNLHAVGLYQGPLLDGFYLSDAVEFERWVERERSRIAGDHAKAIEALAEAAGAGGNPQEAADWWRKRAVQDPFDSRTALLLMHALEAAGNRAGALQHAALHARLLHEEFGIAPGAEITAFAERLRAEPAGSAPAAPGERTVARPQSTAPPPAIAAQRRPDIPASPHTGVAVEVVPPQAAPAAPAAPATPARSGWRTGVAVVTVAVVAGVILFSATRENHHTWLVEEALPQIERHLDVADWEAAYRVARVVEARLPGSSELAELWPRLSWIVTIASEPAGATVFRQSYTADSTEWEELGRTPLEGIRIPYGLSRIRLELNGYRPLLRALGGAHINWKELTPGDPDHVLVGPELYHLDRASALPPDMVQVRGGAFVVGGDSVRMNDYLLGRYEVTNAEFKRFVDAGGYRRVELWDAIVVRGDTIPWADAMPRFVDRTGRPGPATWEAGDYPTGEGDYPVAGVSWYEAAAYARFTGRELPTSHHWQHALANAMFPWLLPASNFGGSRTRSVTQGRAMSHVEVFDLAGNVREWTATAIGSERIILGGSWSDPYYIAGTQDVSVPPEDRSPGNGIRLAVTSDVPAVAARLRAPIARTTAPPAVTGVPVSDNVYAAYSRVFDYDRRELAAVVEAADTTRLWIHERITIDAGYGSERLPLHLYRPVSGTHPYQTIVYWPGWDTFWLSDADEYFVKQLDFIIKSGRAAALPIFRGTFERRVSDERRRPAFGTAEYRDNTVYTVKEMRRAVDYLTTRTDIDHGAIAFYGYSWGGVNGPVAVAQEPRFKAAVIQIGLIPAMAATPEVDPTHSLPRMRVPTLLFSGEFDAMVPRENSARYFSLIGMPSARKRHVLAIGGHFVPRDIVIRETLDWLDRYLGPVR